MEMRLVLGVSGGVGVAMYLNWVSCRSAICSGLDVAGRKDLIFAILAIGGITGALVIDSLTPESWALAVVASLAVVQVPIDISSRRLLRTPTYLATVLLMPIFLVELFQSEQHLRLIAAISVTVLVVALASGVRYVSRDSLGFGDVLLMVPLTLAVAHVALSQVVVWQLAASLSGVVHAVVGRARHQTTSIPFGPHLLIAAWLTLLFSL